MADRDSSSDVTDQLDIESYKLLMAHSLTLDRWSVATLFALHTAGLVWLSQTGLAEVHSSAVKGFGTGLVVSLAAGVLHANVTRSVAVRIGRQLADKSGGRKLTKGEFDGFMKMGRRSSRIYSTLVLISLSLFLLAGVIVLSS
ncbi:MAG: hypothetical protein ACSHW2_03480 [Parasphingopyxis sp.]